jgi:hypothetical protein
LPLLARDTATVSQVPAGLTGTRSGLALMTQAPETQTGVAPKELSNKPEEMTAAIEKVLLVLSTPICNMNPPYIMRDSTETLDRGRTGSWKVMRAVRPVLLAGKRPIDV